jgi:hypothetical protein
LKKFLIAFLRTTSCLKTSSRFSSQGTNIIKILVLAF